MSRKLIFSKIPLLLAISLIAISPTASAWAAPQTAVQQTAAFLPIQQVTPADGATVVRPDATIQFELDKTDPHYEQFVQQFQHGIYAITLNGQPVQGTLNTTTNTIILTNPVLNRNTTYTVLLVNTKHTLDHGVGDGEGDGTGDGKKAYSYSFSFTTGSALHEATHLTAAVEQSPVLVTAGGKLDVKVTDDYGLPANNATVQVTGNSSAFHASVLNLTAGGDGSVVIDLTDHVKEAVNLTVTSQDLTYHDAVDTQTATGSEKYLAGAPDHLTIHADSPLTVGYGEQVTGTVYDVYNNTVEDTTLVSATASNGLLTPQQENTSDGGYAFTFTAPTKVQDVVLMALSGTASGQVTVHLKPDQPANLTLTPVATTVKAGETDDVQVLVTDQYGNTIPNAAVTVTGTGSSQVPSTVTTDDTGHATIAVSDKKAESVTVTATAANGVKGTAQITVKAGDPAHLSLRALAQTIIAGYPDYVLLLVTDQYDNPIPNAQVAVSGTGNSQVLGTVTTDNTGNATILVNDKKAETVTVTATAANGVQGTTQYTVKADYPVHIALTPAASTAKAGETDDVQALVTDQYDNPVPNALLSVTGTGSSQVSSGLSTDDTGYATIAVRDQKVETVWITVTAGGVRATAQIIIQAGDPAKLMAQVDQPTLVADGTSQANATVSVADANGNPVPNAILTLSSTSHAQFPANMTTDASGKAYFMITDTVAETVAINVATANQVTATLTLQTQDPAPKPVIMDNLIPVMTSDTTPSGMASASSETYSTWAYYAFDNSSTSPWEVTNPAGWLMYDFQEPTVVQSYTIQDVNNYPSTAPRNWTFEGWNGTQWVVLDTQTNITNWAVVPKHSFTLTNTTAYTKYRLNVTTNNGSSTLYIAGLTMGGYYLTPFAPTGLTNVKNGDGQAVLSWHAGNGVTGYNVYQDGVKVNSTPITSTSYTITGLVNGQIYHYTVSAVNSAGESPPSAPVLAMPFRTNLIPTMLSDTTPTGIASANAETSSGWAYYAFDNNPYSAWQSNYAAGWLVYDFQEPTVVQEYTIQNIYANTAPKNWTFEGWDGSKWVVLDTQTNIGTWTNYSTESFTMTNTTAYAKYRLNVTSTNGYTSLMIAGLTMAGYYAAPFAPSGLITTKNGDGQVTLSWQVGNGVTGYNVYQDGAKVNSVPITSTSYTTKGLVNGQIYHYTISAVNGAGESPQSAPVMAMPFATNLIPTMTSDTFPQGIASASSEYSKAYDAFDNNSSTAWEAYNPTGWLIYDFQKPTVVQEYTIQDSYFISAPRNWTFQGWDGSKWVVLDTRTNIVNWANCPTQSFTIANTTAYSKYQLNVTADNGYSSLEIAGLVFAGNQN